MAMKALICPQCQAQLEPTEQDMKRGYAECPSCGTIVEFHEVQKVEHSGQIELSNAKRVQNRLNLAQRAYKAENYKEAYDYYTKVLEDIPDDIPSLYRKGICAVHMSTYDNLRIPEFSANFSEATKLFNEKLAELNFKEGEGQQEKENLRIMGQQIGEEVNNLLSNISSNSDLFVRELDDRQDCVELSVQWCEIARLYHAAAAYMPADDCKEKILTAISLVPANYEENILTGGIAFCEKASLHKIKYFDGYTKDSDGNSKKKYSDFTITGAQWRQIRDIRAKLEEKLKNLPARLARMQRMENWIKISEEDVQRLSAECDVAKEKLDEFVKQYWINHSDLEAKFKEKIRTRNIVTYAIVILLMCLAMRAFYVGWMITGGFLFACLIIVSMSRAETTTKEEKEFKKSVFSTEEIKPLKEALDAAKKRYNDEKTMLESMKNKLAAFKVEER